jgi:hypothetical protein
MLGGSGPQPGCHVDGLVLSMKRCPCTDTSAVH